MKEKVKKFIQFFANPRLILCFGLAWIITNGWSYVVFGIGTWLGIEWMQAVGGAYLAFLWFPFSPEKVVTIAISIILLKFFFPNDQKTLAVLKEMRSKVKEELVEAKRKRQEKKQEKQNK